MVLCCLELVHILVISFDNCQLICDKTNSFCALQLLKLQENKCTELRLNEILKGYNFLEQVSIYLFLIDLYTLLCNEFIFKFKFLNVHS